MLWIRGIFWLSAIYDVLIGLAFLVLGDSLFERFQVTPPNHPGYYEFPALLLMIFGVLFARIALDPIANRPLMLFGMALKASYAGLVLYHHFTDGIPGFWIPFALADLGFLVLFLAAYLRTGVIIGKQYETGPWD